MFNGLTVLIDRHVTRYADATFGALAHAMARAGADISIRELPTRMIDMSALDNLGRGVVVGPGSPYDNPDAVIEVIRSARERGVPLVGT